MAKVSFHRGPNANSLPISDGQWLIDTTTGEQFLDISNTQRIKLGGSGADDIAEITDAEILAMFSENS